LNAFEQDFQLTRNQPDTQSRTELRAWLPSVTFLFTVAISN
jgi:hypothetical protein